jgi:hypothetical protein
VDKKSKIKRQDRQKKTFTKTKENNKKDQRKQQERQR